MMPIIVPDMTTSSVFEMTTKSGTVWWQRKSKKKEKEKKDEKPAGIVAVALWDVSAIPELAQRRPQGVEAGAEAHPPQEGGNTFPFFFFFVTPHFIEIRDAHQSP